MNRSIFVAVGLATVTQVFAATEITWVGSKDLNPADPLNWDPQIVPSSKTETAYIANFTNTVTLTSTDTWWYPAGIRVRNGATVTYSKNRCMPSLACEDDKFVIDVGSGSSFAFSGTIFYGQNGEKGAPHTTLVKMGDGTFSSNLWLGQTDRYFSSIEVLGGTIESNCDANKTVTEGLHIANSARFVAKNTFNTNVLARAIQIDAGGTFENLNTMRIPGLAGSGNVVIADGKKLTLTLSDSGKTFSGRVKGALEIEPEAGMGTQPGATMIIGAADTLVGADFSIVDVDQLPVKVLFKNGIRYFGAKSYPTDRTFIDLSLQPVVLEKTANVWYVDDDAPQGGDGKTPETAFRTLAESMPWASENDTVYVLPGVYDKGEMDLDCDTHCRVSVPAKVRLVSTQGAANTSIVGAAAPAEAEVVKGCGLGAVRCVKLAAGALIRGFTITNGHTYAKSSTDGDNGGGVYANSGSGNNVYVEDCVIRNNTAVRGGGTGNFNQNDQMTVRRCTYLQNDCVYQGSASMYGKLYNCIFDGHVAGSYVTLYSDVRNSTFLKGNTLPAVWYSGTEVTADHVVNCIIACKAIRTSKKVFTNCLFLENSSKSGVNDDDIGPGSFRCAADDMGLDATGCPIAGSCVIDRGDMTLNDDEDVCERAFDCAGGQRVYNGKVDLGAYEYDYRPIYSKAFSACSDVKAATAGVELSADSKIKLLNDQTLVSGWKTEADVYPREFRFSVTSGTLKILRNGEVVGEYSADGVWNYTAAVPEDVLTFTYQGTGCALLDRAVAKHGLVIMIR